MKLSQLRLSTRVASEMRILPTPCKIRGPQPNQLKRCSAGKHTIPEELLRRSLTSKIIERMMASKLELKSRQLFALKLLRGLSSHICRHLRRMTFGPPANGP